MARSLTAALPVPPIELWGGLECTVNRVGNLYRDQIILSGHEHRLHDLDRFAEIGFKALRYPVLWERTAPEANQAPNWRWSDIRLAQLCRHGIRPIIGLVHHGSGPRYTHLLDEGFAAGLGRYAAAVAERYPWVAEWTPVNEPLTTARFAALYGHWYPHARDERCFWQALLNQVDGTRAAMKAIRRVNSKAKLIQTDDLGRSYSTNPLAYQAEHDNLRRWAGWDLLFGRIDRHHPLFEPLEQLGFGDRLRAIVDDPCPPDVVGVNHYLTSDRFLDHQIDRYPPSLHGRNCREAFADTEAVRVLDPLPAGVAGALREAWDRYSTPLALTEVHNGSTRDEQLRWAADAWDAAVNLKASGVNIQAVTAWSLLGSQGWDRLQTADGVYEPGLFDVSSGSPRPTALAALWQGLPIGAPRHPVASEAGWWRRTERLLYGDAETPADTPPTPPSNPPLLIVGGSLSRDQSLADVCQNRGLSFHFLAAAIPETGPIAAAIIAMIEQLHPWAIVQLADPSSRPCPSIDRTVRLQSLEEVCAHRRVGYRLFVREQNKIGNPAWLNAQLDHLVDQTGDRSSWSLFS